MNDFMKVICIKENKIREEIKIESTYFVDRESIFINGEFVAGRVYEKVNSTYYPIGVMSLEYFKTVIGE